MIDDQLTASSEEVAERLSAGSALEGWIAGGVIGTYFGGLPGALIGSTIGAFVGSLSAPGGVVSSSIPILKYLFGAKDHTISNDEVVFLLVPHIVRGQDITTADHDDRVVPWHSYKFAAALQAAQLCPNPILLRVETRAGHGAGKPMWMEIEDVVDQWAFVAKWLQLPPPPPAAQ